MGFLLNKRLLFVFVFGLLFLSLSGQHQYSIDKSQLKQSRRLTTTEFFEKKRNQLDERKAISKQSKLDRKTDAIARRYAKKKQKKYVLRRMKESKKMANRINKGKPSVDFITYIQFKMKRYYGRLF
ncbi:MAG: hypothetical protein PHU27_00460 [Salinivirgaceae bacterium]|nr:hypothetical protein [Salinivirgaceae bacterium]MDD4745844.1 hypothetical protein [Salinivirgaceae bacterium]MDY0281262.1 hypothetical protein [Salinivirgaceae bacterium]